MLPPNDLEYLHDRAPGHVIANEAGMTCVVIPRFHLGDGFTRPESDLLFRLAPGYPDVNPDMWWFSPTVQRLDGKPINATQLREYHLSREWQRWSRHLTAGQWRSGVDGIESYIAVVRRELHLAAALAVA
jgi:hypothetical protein